MQLLWLGLFRFVYDFTCKLHVAMSKEPLLHKPLSTVSNVQFSLSAFTVLCVQTDCLGIASKDRSPCGWWHHSRAPSSLHTLSSQRSFTTSQSTGLEDLKSMPASCAQYASQWCKHFSRVRFAEPVMAHTGPGSHCENSLCREHRFPGRDGIEIFGNGTVRFCQSRKQWGWRCSYTIPGEHLFFFQNFQLQAQNAISP